jgi:hypothetical protein
MPPQPLAQPNSFRAEFLLANRDRFRMSAETGSSPKCLPLLRAAFVAGRAVHRALLQRGAIASPASNILPGAGSQFHDNETARQSIYAETWPFLSIIGIFGDCARSGAPAMRAAKRNSPSAQCVHERAARSHNLPWMKRCRASGSSKSSPLTGFV